MITARRVFFEGQVQGVGFRHTAKRLAEGFEVTGWVRNINDGRVEMLVQAETAELEAFLQAIRKSPLAMYIEHMTAESEKLDGFLSGFMLKETL